MRKWIVVTILLIALTVVLAGGAASAQTGDGFDLSWNVISGGGTGPLTGDGFSLRSTLGQAASGLSSGSTYELCAGYWCGVEGEYSIFLPIVLKNL